MQSLKDYFPSSTLKQVFSRARAFDFAVLQQHRDLLELVKSTAYETEQVMGYLKYQKEAWVSLSGNDHPWYENMTESLNTLLRHEVPEGEPVFLFHLESRWLIAAYNGVVIPAIFLFTEHARDGLSISFYRLFGGSALSWIPEITQLFQDIVELQTVEKLPEAVLPFDEMYRFSL